jgi:4-amino-4-deoxy-L-arabinose transferase-like glycosyltransferase
MNHRVVLALACLLLFIQCVVLIQTRWVEDESWNTDESVTWMREGRLRMSSFNADLASVVDARPPLTPIGMGTTFRLFGIGIAQARMFSVVAGIGTVIVVWLLALSFWGPLAASLSAMAAATDLFIVIASRTARPEIHCAFFCSLALLLFYKAREKNSFLLALGSGLSLGAALNFHPHGVGFVAAIGVLLLIEFRARVFLEKRFWALVAGVALSIAPFAIWICSAPVNLQAFRQVYLGRLAVPLSEKLAAEWPRYADFLGFGNRKVPLIGSVPVRLHLALILLAAFVLVYRKNRKLAIELGVVVVVNLLWWADQVSKGPRYFAVIAPIFSVIVGVGLAQLSTLGKRRRQASALLFLLYAGTQLAGNVLWIRLGRKADYPQVAQGLRAAIPPGASVYGAITFYMALNDRVYYSYDRTPFPYALANLHPQYLILWDRVMMHGSGTGLDDFVGLRGQLTSFVRDHATLAARVPNEFYGGLEVYKVQ